MKCSSSMNCTIKSYQTERFLRKIKHGRSSSPEEISTRNSCNMECKSKAIALKEEWNALKQTLSRCYSNCSNAKKHATNDSEGSKRNFNIKSLIPKASIQLMGSCKSKDIISTSYNSENSRASCKNLIVRTINLNESSDCSAYIKSSICESKNVLQHTKLNDMKVESTEEDKEAVVINKVIASTPAKTKISNPRTTMPNIHPFNIECKTRQNITYEMEKSSSTNNIKHINKVIGPAIICENYKRKTSSKLKRNIQINGKPSLNSSMKSTKAESTKDIRVAKAKNNSNNNSLNLSKHSLKEMKALPLTNISKLIKGRESQHKSEMENIDCNKNGPVEFAIFRIDLQNNIKSHSKKGSKNKPHS